MRKEDDNRTEARSADSDTSSEGGDADTDADGNLIDARSNFTAVFAASAAEYDAREVKGQLEVRRATHMLESRMQRLSHNEVYTTVILHSLNTPSILAPKNIFMLSPPL